MEEKGSSLLFCVIKLKSIQAIIIHVVLNIECLFTMYCKPVWLFFIIYTCSDILRDCIYQLASYKTEHIVEQIEKPCSYYAFYNCNYHLYY